MNEKVMNFVIWSAFAYCLILASQGVGHSNSGAVSAFRGLGAAIGLVCSVVSGRYTENFLCRSLLHAWYDVTGSAGVPSSRVGLA